MGKVSKSVDYGTGSAAVNYDGENKYLRITDIDDESNSFSPNPLCSPNGPVDRKYILEKGDIVFARTGASVGKTYLYRPKDERLIFAGFLIRFSIDSSKGSPEFVFFNTLRSGYKNWVSVTSTRSGQPGINAEEYKTYRFMIPEKEEQQKIAAFLSSVDTKIEQLNKKKSLLEQYKKGLMQNLFSREIRFKDEQGGEYPDWEGMKLGCVGKIIGGGTPGTNQVNLWNGDIHWFTPTEIKSKYSENSIRKISKEGLIKSSATLLPVGTILFTSRATIGEASIARKECTTNQGFQSFVVNDSLFSNEYIYYWILKNKKQFLRRANGSTFLEISKGEIKKISFSTPDIKEQQKIASFLSAIDKKIEFVTEQIKQAQTFKKGLLQQMFI